MSAFVLNGSTTSSLQSSLPIIEWNDFEKAPNPDHLCKIPNLPVVLELFTRLEPSLQDTVEAEFREIRAKKCESWVSQIELPRPLFMTKNDLFVVFNRKKFGDLLIGSGVSTNTYYAYSLKNGKLRAYLSLKGLTPVDYQKNVQTLRIAKLFGNAGIGPKILGCGHIKSNSARYNGNFKACAIEQLFVCDLAKAIRQNLIDLTSDSLKLKTLRLTAMEVARLNQRNQIHRDVKFQNFLFKKNKSGGLVIKISDFGFTTPKFVPSMVTKGTPLYVPPECYYQDDQHITNPRFTKTYLTEKLDSWALGINWLRWSVNTGICTLISEDSYMEKKFDQFRQFVEDYLRPEGRGNFEDFIALMLSLGSQTDDWMPKPDESNTFEFVLWNLLRLDPEHRWDCVKAVNYLNSRSSGRITT